MRQNITLIGIKNAGRMLSDNKSLINKAIDTGLTRKVITQIADSKAILPVLLLEGTVIAGRCHQAKKRDELEFKERFREEVLTSAVWLFGVDALNKAFDFILKKALKLDTSADIFNKDVFNRFTKGRSDKFKNTLIGAKFTKVAISTAATIYIIGSLIPKLNQHLTAKAIDERNKKQAANSPKNEEIKQILLKNERPDTPLNRTIAKFSKNISVNSLKADSSLQHKSQSSPSFKGNFMKLINSAGYNMESNPWFKLWTGDAGVSGGRAIHARNNDERAEILFRDVGSIFFYMFSTSLTIKALSSLFDKKLGIHSEINPSLTTHLNKTLLSQKLDNKSYDELANIVSGITPEKVKNVIYSIKNQLPKGTNNIEAKTIQELKNKANLNAQLFVSDSIRAISNKMQDLGLSLNDGLSKESHEIAERMFKKARLGHIDRRIADPTKLNLMIESFKTKIPKDKLSEFMPLLEGISKALSSSAKLSKSEIEEVVKGGLINNPKFIGEAATVAFGPTWFQKIPNYLNSKRHIEASDVQGVKESINSYTEKLLEHIKTHMKKGENLSTDDISKLITGFKNKTALTKIAYSVSGFAVSALFLSYLIPKWQQILTKMRTGSNEFPGTKDMQK